MLLFYKIVYFIKYIYIYYLRKEYCPAFYIERNRNNCQGLSNVAEDIPVCSPRCQFK